MKKGTILSGMRPTGKLHLGNSVGNTILLSDSPAEIKSRIMLVR